MNVQEEKKMRTITKIETAFSEHMELYEKTFNTVLDFDIACMRAVASESATDLSYYNTDVTITWSDGHQQTIRLDVNRAMNLSTFFQNRYRYYCTPRQKPEHMNAAIWMEKKAEYRRWFEIYSV